MHSGSCPFSHGVYELSYKGQFGGVFSFFPYPCSDVLGVVLQDSIRNPPLPRGARAEKVPFGGTDSLDHRRCRPGEVSKWSLPFNVY